MELFLVSARCLQQRRLKELMHHFSSTSILVNASQRVAPARLQLWVSEDFWQTSGAGMVPCGHLMAVMQRPTLLRRQTLLGACATCFGTISLAAQAATRQERKQTSTETPATTTQQFGGEVCVEESWNSIRTVQQWR